MNTYLSFNHLDYRYEIKVPTNIFDDKEAIIQVYSQDKKLIDKISLPLKKMPWWNGSESCIEISESDGRRLIKETNKLISKLNCD
jgi:hypothetical protein